MLTSQFAAHPDAEIIVDVTIDGQRFKVDLKRAQHLAILLEFEPTNQPNAFFLPHARQNPARAGDFVGDTRLGGSANCRDIHLNPHGNGTHTECVGHLVDEVISVGELATAPLIPAVILSAALTRFEDTPESYAGAHHPADHTLTRAALSDAWRRLQDNASAKNLPWSSQSLELFGAAMIIRTLPNPAQKKTRTHSGTNPPYPTTEAITWLMEKGCQHLLVDLPSIDREVDGHRLPNHHQFFELPPNATSLAGAAPSLRTVTEMIFIPNELADGPGFINLQLPRFALDAAPSRPIFYPIHE